LKYLLTYQSLFDGTKQYIKIEVTYTEKQYFPEQYKNIQALFVDELLNEPLFPAQTIRCYALEEMMAEKMRACLSRRKPAIRDFFDLRYMRQEVDLSALKAVVAEKLKENEG
jgi:predicted nucleotidyltransferase component of viral defense system